jgi:uncharacterized protein YrrD
VNKQSVVDLPLAHGGFTMKKLLSTTALALALGLPTLTLAQTTQPAADATSQSQATTMNGFLTSRAQSDILASEVIGHDVYARRSAADGDSTQGQTGTGDGASRDMTMMNRADMENMDNIGQINDVVLSTDGQVRGIVIGVGGFLGMGEHNVALTMDQVTFAFDQDDRSQMYIVVHADADMLENAPTYDRTAMTDDRAGDTTGTRQDDRAATTADSATDDRATDSAATTQQERAPFTRPEVAREGYNLVEATQLTSDMLTGQTVYDVDDRSVGTVHDLILDDSGAVAAVIIDFGGFLGIGSSQVSLGFEELTILSDERNNSVRIYVDATRRQIQDLPLYQASR